MDSLIAYDHAFAGAGPLHVLHAHFLARSGKKVLLIDNGDGIGGAWRVLDESVFQGIEIGCHIWDVDKKVFAFFRDYLKMDMERLSPQPRIIRGSLNVPYDWKNLIFTLRNIAGAAKRFDGKAIFNELFRSKYNKFSLFPSAYLYPQTGANAVMSALEKLVTTNGITVVPRTQLERVIVRNDYLDLHCSDKTFRSTHLHLSSFSKLNEVVSDSETYSVETGRELTFRHIHLRVKNAGPKTLSYIRVMNNELIHRVSDVSEQFNGVLEENERILLVGVFQPAKDEESEKAHLERVLAFLKQRQLVRDNALVVNHFRNAYTGHILSDASAEKLAYLSDNRIHFAYSSNFIYGIALLLDELFPEGDIPESPIG